MPFVIDNSVVCGWFLANQSTDYTEAIARRLLDDGAIAPGLWSLELANVLRSACKRGAMIASQAREVAEQIAALPIAVDAQPPTAQAILALALRYDLSSYDAAYLELALRLQLPIATQDTALAEAAMAAGVGVVR
ncbi:MULTISPECIES: type II toxin-antitoxin system VapC family toxin [Metallibacterium]|jgi:predicted nucleic acid-binding protein|uniref:type II toxin-antitoxin system VapC family toxin n=1 Tax=Metallibacterium TaxID=1218803 RepID=UPI0026156EBC|nr:MULTISPECIES: type II toxin-antitoxin system VapC family toxin [Metallibacterium]MBW8075111.1 PIN domain-containing protein [Metallibacterium scheffleri]